MSDLFAGLSYDKLKVEICDLKMAVDLKLGMDNGAKGYDHPEHNSFPDVLSSFDVSSAQHLVDSLNLSPRNEIRSDCEAESCLNADLLNQYQYLERERDAAHGIRMQLEVLLDSYQIQDATSPISDLSQSQTSDSVSLWMLSPSTIAVGEQLTESFGYQSMDGEDRKEAFRSLRAEFDQVFSTVGVETGYRRRTFCEWIIAPSDNSISLNVDSAHVYSFDTASDSHCADHVARDAMAGPCAGLAAFRTAVMGDPDGLHAGACPALTGLYRAVGLGGAVRAPTRACGAVGRGTTWSRVGSFAGWMRL